jgi:hypothetical protein
MKVKISPDGCLSITPESELELYAVSQWWANFNQGMHNSEMHVARSLEEPAADPPSQPLPAPTTQRAQRLLDELEEGGLPAVLNHLAVAWKDAFSVNGRSGANLLKSIAAELEGKR